MHEKHVLGSESREDVGLFVTAAKPADALAHDKALGPRPGHRLTLKSGRK